MPALTFYGTGFYSEREEEEEGGGAVLVVVVREGGGGFYSCFLSPPYLHLHSFPLLPHIPSSPGVGGQTVEHVALTLLC